MGSSSENKSADLNLNRMEGHADAGSANPFLQPRFGASLEGPNNNNLTKARESFCFKVQDCTSPLTYSTSRNRTVYMTFSEDL